ncbi:MAG: hypothetical protein LQ342_008453 [Letrouitia transgressa]|nr:MAG: hypothetical protein LQ342_008453 [Letrouitia transgressa]
MSLTGLPNELLEHVIIHTLPEGFECLILTCKKIYTICVPFLEHHNALRSQFHRFAYNPGDPKNLDHGHITCAWDLIARIATEPVVARYIRHPDFGWDSRFILRRHWQFEPEDDIPAELNTFFADSAHLKEAKLDWHQYHATIIGDLQAPRYSQQAACFLLTLLPNVETLRLPRTWLPDSASGKLLDVIIKKTKNSQSLPWNTPSLYRTNILDTNQSPAATDLFDLAYACPFLALPHIRTFWGTSCAAIRDTHPSKGLYPGSFGEALVAVHLLSSCIDEVGITAFLKYTTHLRTLVYSHSTKGYHDAHTQITDWNSCKFVMAIERAVASHLEELSISIRELTGSLTPGTVSLRGFQRLRKLELPLELLACNIAAAATPRLSKESSVLSNISSESQQSNDGVARIGDLLPASVSEISLRSDGRLDHAKALEEMFQEFAALKEAALPALKNMQLSCINGADEEYKKRCNKLNLEMEVAGVHLDLVSSLAFPTLTWDGDD